MARSAEGLPFHLVMLSFFAIIPKHDVPPGASSEFKEPGGGGIASELEGHVNTEMRTWCLIPASRSSCIIAAKYEAR